MVSERLGHANISITLDTYIPCTARAARSYLERFDNLLNQKSFGEKEDTCVSKMFANNQGVDSEPPENRTRNLLIKK